MPARALPRLKRCGEMLNVRESGQGLAEYALILSLIAIAAVMALIFLSGTIQSVLSIIGSQL